MPGHCLGQNQLAAARDVPGGEEGINSVDDGGMRLQPCPAHFSTGIACMTPNGASAGPEQLT